MNFRRELLTHRGFTLANRIEIVAHANQFRDVTLTGPAEFVFEGATEIST